MSTETTASVISSLPQRSSRPPSSGSLASSVIVAPPISLGHFRFDGALDSCGGALIGWWMRALVKTVAVIALVAMPTACVAGGISFTNLDIAADLRFVGTHCFALKTDWPALEDFLRHRGVSLDIFDPGSIQEGYISARDKRHELDLRAFGDVKFCGQQFRRFSDLGIFTKLTPFELDELNDLRKGTGGAPIRPIE